MNVNIDKSPMITADLIQISKPELNSQGKYVNISKHQLLIAAPFYIMLDTGVKNLSI